MTTTIITMPTRTPVTLADVKAHLHITGTDHDDLLYGLLMAATSMVENYTHRKLVRQTIDLYMDYWPDGDIILPGGQLQSVTHIKYTDSDDDETTISSDDYTVDTYCEPGRIVLDYGTSWPSFTPKTSNPIVVRFVCGNYSGDYWASEETYAVGDYVEPTNANGNGLVYVSGDAGDSDTTEPTWPTTVGGTVVDDEVTWTCVGRSVPKAIRQAIMVQIAELFKLREPYILAQTHKPLRTVQALLWPYRVFGAMT